MAKAQPTRRRRGAKKSLGKIAKRQVKSIVRKEMARQIEDKQVQIADTTLNEFGCIDANGGTVATDVTNGYWSGDVFSGTDISGGVLGDQHVGDEIMIKKITLDLKLFSQGNNNLLTDNRVKLVLVKVKLPQPTSSFNVQQMYDEDLGLAALNPTMTNIFFLTPGSLRNKSFFKSYKVLATRTFYWAGEDSSTITSMQRRVRLTYKPKKPVVQKFDPDTGALAETGYRLLCMVDDGNIGGAPTGSAVPSGITNSASNSGFYFFRTCRVDYYDP